MRETVATPPRRPGRPATIHDVAALAGVSISTVSRVLNGSQSVDADLAVRVLRAAKDLKYQPNRAARSLVGGRSRTVGLLIADLHNAFFLELVRGVEDTLQRAGYMMLLGNMHDDPAKERDYIKLLCEESVAGAIITPATEKRSALAPLLDRGIPVVSVDRRIKDPFVDSVLIDNVSAMRELVQHLLQNGYRRIGLITWLRRVTPHRERFEGYCQALASADIGIDPALVREVSRFGDERGYLAEMLSIDNPIDAIVAGYNTAGMAILEELSARGLRIPENIAVAGFDMMTWVVPGAPTLTAVQQPVYELGAAAAARLVERLNSPGAAARQETTLAYELRIGESSRARSAIALGDAAAIAGNRADVTDAESRRRMS